MGKQYSSFDIGEATPIKVRMLYYTEYLKRFALIV